MNEFLEEISRPGVMDARTENGAIAHSTTGSTLADQFSKSGSHRDRSVSIVFAEQAQLDQKYGKWALRFVFYLRLITRIIKFFDGSKSTVTQRGQGNRDESYKRYLWYAQNKPDLFYRNFTTFVECGSIKDVFEIMWYAKRFKIEVDEKRLLAEIIVAGGEEMDENDLLLKYLPLQKAASKAVTERAKYRNHLARMIQDISNMNAKELRTLKAAGKAHTWQQLISKRLFDMINFHLISGKALTKLVSSKFLTKHGLVEKYEKWIAGQSIAKFTGYIYELRTKVTSYLKSHEKMTYDKQFLGLLQTGKQSTLGSRKVICAIDRSGSMDASVAGTTAMKIAESLGVYFANLLEGPFQKWVIRFSNRSEWVELKGGFCDQINQMQWGDCPSNTDFQSIIDSFVNIRKDKPEISEEHYPNTLLVISDMQFDKSYGWGAADQDIKTEYQRACDKLRNAFSNEFANSFVFIWWQVNGRITNQPARIEEPGGYFVSGFDGAIIDSLLGSIERKESVEQSIETVLSQEVLERIEYSE